ncbi:MAG TPA: HAMP domain-containing sensor histidine kinase [Microvirga sp.]|jgi:signal transduction histidine kinase|nr:HAMP domain-containing sensor histidine kinase [Microvirga sp.]
MFGNDRVIISAVDFIVLLLLAAVYLSDMMTAADNVSIAFIYCVPIVVSLLHRSQRSFLYAAIASMLTVIGSFFQPPLLVTDLATFAANRAIAVATQWLVAVLVWNQKRFQDALEARIAEEREKVETQRRFITILSHEFGNALTTIEGQAYRMAALSASLGPRDISTRANKIRAAADRIQAVVSRIQLASTLENRNLELNLGTVDAFAIVRGIVEQFKDDWRHRIELEQTASTGEVGADRDLISQVFENLLINALQYSGDGRKVVVRCAADPETVSLTVADTGPGIPEDELPRLRTAYYRGTGSQGTKGTGLGLYFANQIIEAHGGRLLIASVVGQGTSVTVELSKRTPAGTRLP